MTFLNNHLHRYHGGHDDHGESLKGSSKCAVGECDVWFRPGAKGWKVNNATIRRHMWREHQEEYELWLHDKLDSQSVGQPSKRKKVYTDGKQPEILQ